MTRDERQDICENKYLSLPIKTGTLEAPTGFGKTVVGCKLIKRLRRSDSTRKVIVVVPTIPLKEQWEEVLLKFNERTCTEVFVVNTLIKLPSVECKMLILDEIHRYAARTFKKVFDVVKYSFGLGLTATINRMDGKHKMLKEKMPIFDSITLSEAKRNKWISSYREYNLGLDLPEKDFERYLEKKRIFDQKISWFSSDYQFMQMCSMTLRPWRKRNPDGSWGYKRPPAVEFAANMGWRGNSVLKAKQILDVNLSLPKGSGRRENIWGGDTNHPYHPDKVQMNALIGIRTNKEINDLLQNHMTKIIIAKELIENLNRKTVVFSQSIEPTERLYEMLGEDRASLYHSNVKGQVEMGKITKEYKNEKAMYKWLSSHPEWSISDQPLVIEKPKKINISAAEIKREAIYRIKNDPNCMTICTAMALDLGFDYEGAEMGITLSRSNNPTQQTQRTGRIVRLYTYEDGTEKEAILINLYFRDTREYKKLVRAQKRSAPGIIWVDSVEEILSSELITNAYA